MPSKINVGGSWHSAPGLLTKVNGSWHAATKAYVKVSGTWRQYFTQVVTDTFTRSTSTGLGTSDVGVSWSSLSGNWFVNGSQAQSNDTSALSVVSFPSSDVVVSASVSNGVGPAFWVQDANNWWAAIPYVTTSSYSYTYSCCSSYPCTQSGCSSYTCACGNAVAGHGNYQNCLCPGTGQSVSTPPSSIPCGSSCSSCGTGVACDGCSGGYYSGTILIPRTCAGHSYHYVPASYTCDCGYGAVAGSPDTMNCCCGYSYTTTCSSCSTCTASGTNYNYFLRIVSSVNGTISYPTSDLSLGQNISVGSIQVVASGTSISATAYSDQLTTSLGTLTYTPSSPTLGTNCGIIKTNISALQGSTADNFSAGQ